MRARGFVVYLQVDVAGQLERLARDRTRPLLQREDREDVLRQLSTARAPLYAEVADLCFDTNGLGSNDAACQLGRLLADRWQRSACAGLRQGLERP
jgi:shikimate kinase